MNYRLVSFASLFLILVLLTAFTLAGIRPSPAEVYAATLPAMHTIDAGGTTTRVSVASDGTQGNAESSYPSLSADGRYVAFESYASNLVPGDANGTTDIFLRDQQTGQTELVSVASDGTQATGTSQQVSISANGRYVAFASLARNLVPGDANAVWDVFVHDRQTGQTELVSVASDGTQGNDESCCNPSISADGRYVAFESYASNLVPGDTNSDLDVFVHDRQTGQTELVSVASDGTQGNDESCCNPSLSADGRYVAFESYASNLVSGDANGTQDIFVRDRRTGQTELVSVASDGTQATGTSSRVFLSADGRYVAFTSLASNLVPGDTNNRPDVFVHARQTGQTTRVSVASDGTQGNGNSGIASISADGRYVAFASYASNLVPGDANGTADIYLHDRQTGQTELVSVASDGTQANAESHWSSLSADGRYVAFESWASNLVAGDTNDTGDVFVHDRGSVEPTYAISGRVTDGHGHPLPSVFVGLLAEGESSYAATTTADSQGEYLFPDDLPPGDYAVRVVLRDGDGFKQILWGEIGLLANGQTPSVSWNGTTPVTVNVDLGDASLDSLSIPIELLDDLAAMYYHTSQVDEFALTYLGVPDYHSVNSIWGFAPTISGSAYYTDTQTIRFGEDQSRYESDLNSCSRPMNRDWHENFHYLMDFNFDGLPPFTGIEENHGGFSNTTTDDSWVEGWAEFFPSVLADTLGWPHPDRYWMSCTPIPLEFNWEVWDTFEEIGGDSTNREEFAVASLLWDLYDPKSSRDIDTVDLSLDALWGVIGHATEDNDLTDMRDVYEALIGASLVNEDGSPVATADIDAIFVIHGFFADDDPEGDPDHHVWNPGEDPGWGGRPGRRNTVTVENSYIKVNVENEDGEPVAGGSILIEVVFDNDYYNYSYAVTLPDSADGLVYMEPPPARVPAAISIAATYGIGKSETYTVDNATYWDLVATSATGYTEELTFTIRKYTLYLPIVMKNTP